MRKRDQFDDYWADQAEQRDNELELAAAHLAVDEADELANRGQDSADREWRIRAARRATA